MSNEKTKNIVFIPSDNVREKMVEYYSDKKREKTPAYTLLQAKEADTIITIYESGKVMFQGLSADIDANMWFDMEKHLNNKDVEILEKKKKEEEKDLRYYNYSAIGSDEVGTGDYFLPIVVSASFVNKKEIPFLQELGVSDSKKLTDDKIKKIAPKIIERIPYETIILSNKEYNDFKDNEVNMNKVKAILHNQVLFKMLTKSYPYEKIIVDQFTYPRSYFGYLNNQKNIVKNITFLTKAEDKNLSVACASVISRYLFLIEMEKLNKEYNISFPKGAGIQVDQCGKELVKKYGKDILEKISKISFKNTEKILEK